eukprot:scaffold15605_cov37-Attheya_sp.AAC.2
MDANEMAANCQPVPKVSILLVYLSRAAAGASIDRLSNHREGRNQSRAIMSDAEKNLAVLYCVLVGKSRNQKSGARG